jgi:hypothetical protein
MIIPRVAMLLSMIVAFFVMPMRECSINNRRDGGRGERQQRSAFSPMTRWQAGFSRAQCLRHSHQ